MKATFGFILCVAASQVWAAAPSPEEAKQTHWAFREVSKPSIPTGVSEIDALVGSALREKGLAPAPEARRTDLVRRVAVDLTGLPPSEADAQSFVSDDSPNAYERLVDRMLASPRVGERWGRYWLDLTRYADSKGYVFEEERRYPYAYTYRDWVIDSFNHDLPYDHFLIQQIAGDFVAKESGDNAALAAMGAFTLGRRFLNREADIIDDRIDVLTRGMLGLTVACARCHDHKFDPIPTDDYYSLYGVFASSMEPEEKPLLEKPSDSPRSREFERGLKEREGKLQRFFADKHANLRKEETLRAYFELAFEGQDWEESRYDSAAQQRKLYQRTAQAWRRYLKGSSPVFAAWRELAKLPAESFAQERDAALAKLDGTSHALVREELQKAAPKSMKEVAAVYAKLLAAANADQVQPDPQREALRQVLVSQDSPTGMKPEALYRVFNTPDQQNVRRLRREIEQYQATAPTAPPRAMSLADKERPVDPRVFVRGSEDRPGKAVPRQFLAVLSEEKRQPFQVGSGRFELAKEIASKKNPLTARVFANRVWLAFFGQGIVDTPSDFGVRTARPALGDVLDYLAWQFMAEDWSMKKLQRRILLSQAYQQSSRISEAAERLDPENRLASRMNRRRLDFEAFRDSVLDAAGRLDDTRGGHPVDIEDAPFSTRRSIYGYIDRQNLPAMFRTFDFASPDAHSPRRYNTTVPQQALFLLNSPFMAEQVAALAKLGREMPSPSEAIDRIYVRIFRRAPTADEKALGGEFLAEWKADPSGPKQAADAWEAYVQALICSNEFMFLD